MATPAFCSNIPYHLVCAKNNDPLPLQAMWPWRVMEAASDDIASTIYPTEMVWDEFGHRVKEKHPTSAQHLWELLQVQLTTPWNSWTKCRKSWQLEMEPTYGKNCWKYITQVILSSDILLLLKYTPMKASLIARNRIWLSYMYRP